MVTENMFTQGYTNKSTVQNKRAKKHIHKCIGT